MKHRKIVNFLRIFSISILLSACNSNNIYNGFNPRDPGIGNNPDINNPGGNIGNGGTSDNPGDSSNSGSSSSGLSGNENNDVIHIDTPEDTNSEEFAMTCDDMSTITKAGNVYTITTSTPLVYSLSGKINGQIVVDSTAKVELDLNNVSLEYNQNSPIYVKASDDVEIKSPNGTVNYIYDKRSAYTSDEEGQGKGAIYIDDGDIKFTGKGTLQINAGYYNGIHTKDDFTLKNTNIEINAPHNGIKANDGIVIESGALNIDCGNDGLITESTSISEKGNQKGDINISGGSVLINSVGDGIAAAHDALVSGTAALEIKTDKYSSYSGETTTSPTTSSSKWYIRMSSSLYSTSYRYAAYINNQWVDFTFKTQQNSGRSRYYIYESTHNANASSFTLYRFASTASNSLDNYNAKSDAKSFSTYSDMLTISSVSGKTINLGSWSTYSAGGGGFPGGPGSEGNTDKSEHSAKGIKANNEIHIEGGSIAITAYDDGIHTNCDSETFENGLAPTGNLFIKGGEIAISASDDGIHSDTNLNISGGKVLISESYEGIEGNVINISGGDVTVFAKDDGVNASSGKASPAINISGGRLDETVSPNGDTDGIDSNGTYTQTGGIVIARGPNSAMAAALDTDGAVKISGGTLILLGSIEKTPTLTNITVTSNLSGHSTGDHTISIGNNRISYNNKYAYAKTTVYSELGSATIA